MKLEDFLRQAATDIVHLLKHPPSSVVPSLQAGDPTYNALRDIATIFNQENPLPTIMDRMKPGASSVALKAQPSISTEPFISPPPPAHLPALPRVSTLVPNMSTLSPRVTKQIPVPISTPTSKKPQDHPTLSPNTHNHRSRIPEHPLRLKITRATTKANPNLLKVQGTPRLLRSNTHTRSFRSRAVDHLLAQHLYQKYVHHIYDAQGIKQSVEKLLNGEHGTTRWQPAMSNEWGRLATVNQAGVQYTDTIEFISQEAVPTDTRVTYASFVCDHRPLKTEPWRIRLVVGGDKLVYGSDAGSPATDMLETKLLFNSTISNTKHGDRFMSLDLKDMFLQSEMEKPEYMWIPFKYFPKDIIPLVQLKQKSYS